MKFQNRIAKVQFAVCSIVIGLLCSRCGTGPSLLRPAESVTPDSVISGAWRGELLPKLDPAFCPESVTGKAREVQYTLHVRPRVDNPQEFEASLENLWEQMPAQADSNEGTLTAVTAFQAAPHNSAANSNCTEEQSVYMLGSIDAVHGTATAYEEIYYACHLPEGIVHCRTAFEGRVQQQRPTA